MSEQYLRKSSLIVGADGGDGLDLSQLRFSFCIQRGDIETPNSADIRVYNPSPKTVAALFERGSKMEFTTVMLQAGYEGSYGLIFQGTIKQVRYGRENQTDTYLDVTAADGDSAYNFSTVALSLAAGQTAPADAVQSIIQTMAGQAVSKGYLPTFGGNALPRGKVMYGMSRDEMRKIAANTGCSWSIQDGKIVMIPLTGYMVGDVPELNRETGMIGLPEQTQDGITIKTLLNPNLKIGQAVKIDNKSIQRTRFGLDLNSVGTNSVANETATRINTDGLYYVMQANHTGDTRGQAWYSDLLCLAIDLTYPNGANIVTDPYATDGPVKRNG